MLKFFETLLNMSITGAVIIAFVMIVRLFLKKLPRKYSYILWIIPAIRLLIPFSVAAPVSVFNFIHIPEPHAAVADYGEVTEPPALTYDIFTDPITDAVTDAVIDPVTDAVTDEGYFDSVPDGWYTGENVPQITGPVFTYEVITHEPAITDAPAVNETPAPEEPNTALTLWRAACAIWVTGVIAMFCYLAYSFAATKRAVEYSYKIGEGLYSNGYIDTPFVFGYIKPRIYVPFGLDDKEFAYVVAHERTHIKRGDHIIKAVASLILCVHWFNPLAWLAFKLMTVDMELSCDERALNTYELEARKDYARTLLSMSVVSKKVPFHGMLSFGESSIKSRIKGILRMKKPAAWACVLAVAVIITAAVCLLTNAEQTPPDIGGETTTDPVDTMEPVDTDEPLTTDAPVTTDPPMIDGETEHLFEDKLKDYTSADVKIGVTVPAVWSFEGDTATVNGEKCFEFVSAWPEALGLDTESIKTSGGYADVTRVEEKTGEPGEVYNYLYHGKTANGEFFEYVVLRNGYYVHLRLHGIPADVNSILRSVRVFNDMTKFVGDLLMISSGDYTYNVDVINLDVEAVEVLERIQVGQLYKDTVRYVEFRNKYLNITGTPALVSGDILGFKVAEDCILYTVVDGAIYTKDMSTLVAFPPAVTGEYTLPDSVTHIDDYAFYGSKLSKLNVPASIERIGALNGAEGVEVKLVKSEIEEYNVWGELIKKTVVESVDGKLHKYVNTFTYEITHIDETHFYIDGVLQYCYERISYTGSRDRIRSETTKYYNADGTEKEYTAKNYDWEGRVVSETYYENGKPVKKEFVYPDGVTRSLIYTVDDAVKYWLGNRSFYTMPEKGGINPHRYSDLVIEYEYEYADEISEMYEDPAVAEAYGYEQGSSVTVVKAYFSGGRISGDAFIPVVIVRNKDGIYSPIDEVSVSTRTVAGVISKVAEVKEDKTLKEYTVSSGAVFVLSASLDWQPCDKVSVSYTNFRGSSIIYPSEIVATSNIYTNIEKLADAPIAAGFAEHKFSASETTDSSVTIKVGVSLPSDWVVSGSAAARSGLRHFAFVNKVTPQENGVDVEKMRVYNNSALTVVSEKKGSENDIFAYYVYAESPNVTDWKITKYIHRYAVLSNGYYVYIDFNADVGIASETVEAILKSVNAGSKWEETVISVSPPGNIIYVRIGNGELYVNVEELTAENVDYLHSFVYDEYSYMKQNSITFPNKELVLTANPNLISEKTEKYEIISGNNNYVSVDGVVYTKDMETLVAFPPARTGEFTLPGSVTHIDDYAFYGSRLTKIYSRIGVDLGERIGGEKIEIVDLISELKGPVGDVGELTADGTGRKCLLQLGVLYYPFTAPADMDIRVGDLVTVTFNGTAIHGINRENVTLGVVSHEDADRTVTMADHFIERTYDPGQTVRIDFVIPSDWILSSGSTYSRNNLKFMVIGDFRAVSDGLEPDRFKKLIDYDVEYDYTVFDEKYGTEDDPFAYYIHRSIGAKYTCDGTYDTYDYVIEDNGWYITFSFLCDADIPQEIVDEIVRSVKMGR